MADDPVLTQFALKLDPMDRDAITQFRRVVEYLTVNLEAATRVALVERVTNAVAMLELASITGEASFRFRNELVSAAQAIDKAVSKRGDRGRSPVPLIG